MHHCPIPDTLGARFLGAVEDPKKIPSTHMPPKAYLFPVPGGYITSLFGPRKHPITGAVTGANHGALDIGAQPGAVGKPIIASASGVVTQRNDDITRREGRSLYVKHDDGWTSTYSHLSAHLLKKGDRFKKGQVIARLGNTGSSTAPHLHWKLRNATGVNIDPLNTLTGNQPLSTNLAKKMGAKTIPGMHPGGPSVFFLAAGVAGILYFVSKKRKR